MRNAFSASGLRIVCLALCLAGLSPLMAYSDELEDTGALDRIRAYEEQFKISAISAYVPVQKRYLETLGFSGSDINYVYDNQRKRREKTNYHTYGSKSYEVSVTDGEIWKEWRYSDKNNKGQGTIDALRNDSPSFLSYFFMPHLEHDILDYKSAKIVSRDKGRLTVEYVRGDVLTVSVEYEEYGEFLRPLSIQKILYDRNTKKSRNGTLLKYHYSKDDEKDPKVFPVRIEQISKIHDAYTEMKVKKVDFDPQISDDMFKIDFPQGTWVRNKILEKERDN